MVWHSIILGGKPWLSSARLCQSHQLLKEEPTARLVAVICSQELADLNLGRVQGRS
jgi:hypothetical protein